MKRNLKKLVATALMFGFIGSWTGRLVAFPEVIANRDSSVSVVLGGAYLLFAGKFGGDVSKKEIESQRDLAVDGCAKGSRIFKYTLVVNKGGQSSTYQSSSNVLTSEMHSKLKSLSAGDYFEFSQIKAYLPNGKDVVEVSAKKYYVI